MSEPVTLSTESIRGGVVRAVKMISDCDDSVTDHTELYYDLGIAGDDLFELITVIESMFGTDFSLMNLGHYAPGEAGHNFGLNFVREFREWRGERTYRSLTVATLVAAIQSGVWVDR